ncbi:hypothetical protein AWC38_SpisGene10224 [Stylophora pistillata]|uniref:Uncharacterized protein n=1 Tax=Stylophora pistillata TaxID=50429 RepID=A0A2B4S371_STYPI|nr:hypothetical protein AWC38_SpisGene10224 [Stylophora pistillata]
MAAMAGESTTASSGSSTSTGKRDKGKGWHWNFAAALCTNNWRNKDLTYYTLLRIGSSTDAALRASYMKLLKNDDINWKKAVISSQHWSKGKRENLYDLPDRVCNEQYVQNLEKSASKCAKLKAKKLVAAKRSLEFSSCEVKSKRRIIVKKEREKDKEINPVLNQASGKDESQYRLENEILRNQCEELASKLKEKDKEMERLKYQVEHLLDKEKKQENKINELTKEQFTYMMLKDKQDKFIYLTGLTTNEFDCLYECVEPFLHLIRYPDCKARRDRLQILTQAVAWFYSGTLEATLITVRSRFPSGTRGLAEAETRSRRPPYKVDYKRLERKKTLNRFVRTKHSAKQIKIKGGKVWKRGKIFDIPWFSLGLCAQEEKRWQLLRSSALQQILLMKVTLLVVQLHSDPPLLHSDPPVLHCLSQWIATPKGSPSPAPVETEKSTSDLEVVDAGEEQRTKEGYSLEKAHFGRFISPVPWNIYFTLNTNGVSVLSSSKKGYLWSVCLAINELPIEQRYSKKYLIPALLYCHKGTPNMHSLLIISFMEQPKVSLALGMLDRLPNLCLELTNRASIADEVKTMIRKLTVTERRINITHQFESSTAVGKVIEATLDPEALVPVNLLSEDMGLQALTGESRVKQCD